MNQYQQTNEIISCHFGVPQQEFIESITNHIEDVLSLNDNMYVIIKLIEKVIENFNEKEKKFSGFFKGHIFKKSKNMIKKIKSVFIELHKEIKNIFDSIPSSPMKTSIQIQAVFSRNITRYFDIIEIYQSFNKKIDDAVEVVMNLRSDDYESFVDYLIIVETEQYIMDVIKNYKNDMLNIHSCFKL